MASGAGQDGRSGLHARRRRGSCFADEGVRRGLSRETGRGAWPGRRGDDRVAHAAQKRGKRMCVAPAAVARGAIIHVLSAVPPPPAMLTSLPRSQRCSASWRMRRARRGQRRGLQARGFVWSPTPRRVRASLGVRHGSTAPAARRVVQVSVELDAHAARSSRCAACVPEQGRSSRPHEVFSTLG